jgi:hypothetical protein
MQMKRMNFWNVLLLAGMVLNLLQCAKNDMPAFALGRYEYAGIDNKTFRFFRVETG